MFPDPYLTVARSASGTGVPATLCDRWRAGVRGRIKPRRVPSLPHVVADWICGLALMWLGPRGTLARRTSPRHVQTLLPRYELPG